MFNSFKVVIGLGMGLAFSNATCAETDAAASKNNFSTFIESQAHKGPVRQLLYRAVTLRKGLEYFRSLNKPSINSADARPTVRNRVVFNDHRDGLTEQQFIKHFDTVISDDLKGVKLEDMMLVKFIEKLSGRVGKNIGDATSLGSAYFNNMFFIDPLDTSGFAFDIQAESNFIYDQIYSNGPLAEPFSNALKAPGLDVTDVNSINNSTEIRVGNMRSEQVRTFVNQVNSELANIRAEREKLESAIREKTAVTDDYERYAAATLSGSGPISLLKDALRLEAANVGADEVPSYKDAMDQASGYLHLVETFGSGLDGLAAANGASAKQRGILQSSTAAASALVTITNSSGNTLMLANGYTGMAFAAMTLLTYATSDDEGNASEGIFEALRQIAEELHAMRLEMHRRLDRLDAAVAEGFTRQSVLLDQILRYEQGGVIAIEILRSRVEAMSADLRDIILDSFNRENEIDFKSCGLITSSNLNIVEQQTIQACALLATSIATTRDSISIAKSFDEFFPLSDDLSRSQASKSYIKNFNDFGRVMPLYAEMRTPSINIMNPIAWGVGTQVAVNVTRKHPEQVAATDLPTVLRTGKSIQVGLRNMFSQQTQSGLYLNSDVVVQQFVQYFSALANYLHEIKRAPVDLEFPFLSTSQRLPEELPVPSQGYSGKHFRGGDPCQNMDCSLDMPGNPDAKLDLPEMVLDDDSQELDRLALLPTIVNTSYGPRIAPGRGEFRRGVDGWNYSLVGKDILLCPDVQPTVQTGRPSPEYKFGSIHNGRLTFIDQTIKFLRKGGGLRVDGSILKLVPREVLWMERMTRTKPEKVNLIACIKTLGFSFMGYRKRPSPSMSIVVPDISLDIEIQFALKLSDDSEQSIGVSRSHIEFALPVSYHNDLASFGRGAFPYLEALWNGTDHQGAKVGPILGNFDKYFEQLESTAEEKRALDGIQRWVRETAETERGRIVKQLRTGGEAGEARKLAIQRWRILKNLRLLSMEEIPELTELFDYVDEVPDPDTVANRVFEGLSEDRMLQPITRHWYVVYSLAASTRAKVLEAPLKTMIDGDLASLELLVREQSH